MTEYENGLTEGVNSNLPGQNPTELPLAPEPEYISGFIIEKRILNNEETAREITLERFRKFHYEAGEDFIDTVDSFLNEKVFAGLLIHKYPNFAEKIIQCSNDEDIFEIKEEIPEQFGYDETKDIDMIYEDIAEFANVTEITKEKINQVLIQVKEYYE